MTTFIFTKEEAWLKKWDQFVAEHPKGSHLVFSDWLKSYTSYGFDYELGLVLEENRIIGGYGVVIPKFLFFKFYIIPHGPIYLEGYANHLKAHVLEIKNHAKQMGACYLQMSFPVSAHKKVDKQTYDVIYTNSLTEVNFKPGKLFNYVYTSYGLNWVDLSGYQNADAYLEQLTPKVRRNIRMGYNKFATFKFLTEMGDLEQGYEVILENANQGGYSVRSFSEFKTTMFQLISKNRAYFIVCEVDGKIKAAAFVVKASGYLTNIMGGVLRDKPDIKLGYMLQWEIIKKSFECDYMGYNISMGGSQGVQEFKAKFGAEAIVYQNPHYHLILKPTHFKLYKLFDTKFKPYKHHISQLLSRLKS